MAEIMNLVICDGIIVDKVMQGVQFLFKFTLTNINFKYLYVNVNNTIII